ncbi:hypothetical protein LTR91_022588 [Friedmanniomyces endolithicus]|uniref:Lipocalin-like domain-containing protein n=1 Tax=Friedmanniomyces endolithicus TaxID=329885 RepID=A0A4U0V372_9PEZI|nr:hypothetical protein LTS09_006744 [Friedmanniomyces endolithicus]KAK0320740.1 hypothetical protein LTR82_008453 [Friedmanniomyces endolithicus]KAK0928145.1 hypothetical protein LTR57_002879 [Friedmanniomyces endolithicus]KAK0956003.1 hypothetical protein LTR91_022588 [Friedmanniomyces endolithicus]KAK1003200.1 hypothetical protein LTS01_004071 [Friedmanniomyces endolithicus]
MAPQNVWPTYSSRIAGVWKTISFEIQSPTGTLLAKPHGDKPLGRVQISPHGYLSAHMADPQRMSSAPPSGPSGKAWVQAGDAEVAAVARGVSMYCGYLELFEGSPDGDEGEEGAKRGLWWQTRVDVSSDPSRMGGLEVRNVELMEEGGKQFMVLRPRNDMVLEDGTRGRGVLKWEKIE